MTAEQQGLAPIAPAAAVLGIESSCDETAAAVVRGGRAVLSSVIASQVDLHRKYGGVVPEIASRRHLETIVPVLREAVAQAGIGWSDLQAVAVARGPGLVGTLLVGLSAAKALAFALDVPLLGVNHLEGHIYANFLAADPPAFPFVCLVVSGGHTELIYMAGHGSAEVLGRTRDDAAGEAFDKVARLLGLGYPGGPLLEDLARRGDREAVRLPRAYLEPGSYDFSFSGLKTAVRQLVERPVGPARADVAAAFQWSVVEVLVNKTVQAARDRGVETVLLAGGVAANGALRAELADRCTEAGLVLRVPAPAYCTDNAAMIACAGFYALCSGRRDGLDLAAAPALGLG